MSEKVKVILVTMHGVQTFEVAEENLVAAMSVRGFEHNGRFGGAHLREELRGKPCFEGLSGPCYGGPEHPVRYEDWATQEMLSR